MCTEEANNIPEVITDCRILEPRNNFTLKTLKTLIIKDTDENWPFALKRSLYILNNAERLEEIAFDLKITRIAIIQISKVLTKKFKEKQLYLFVSSLNLNNWHKYFDAALNFHQHKINIYLIQDLDENSIDDSNSNEIDEIDDSSDEDGFELQASGVKRSRSLSLYETHLDVKRELKRLKVVMMKPYIENRRAKLRSKQFPVVRFLKDKNLIDSDLAYQSGKSIQLLDDRCIYTSPFDYEAINQYISSSVQPFIHSIVFSNKLWIMVTQIDVFIRNYKEIDNCSLDTYDLPPYYNTPTPMKLHKSSGRGNSWYELCIFVGRLELLVTGGLFGEKGSENVLGYLGPSLTPLEQLKSYTADNEFDILYTPSTKDIIPCERLQRNYSRSSSSFRWSFKSLLYLRKGFHTASPFYFEDDTIVGTASYILRCICHNLFTQQEYNYLLAKIRNIITITDVMQPITNDINFLRRIHHNVKINEKLVVGSVINLVEGFALGRIPQVSVNGEMATQLYNVVKAKCTTMNNKTINKKAFLL